MEKYDPRINTPNLDYNLKQLYGKKKVKWDSRIDFDLYSDLAEFDLSGCFLENCPNVICATARKITDLELELSIYRYHEKDLIIENKPVNRDVFIIKKAFYLHKEFTTVLKSTEVNQNMVNTLKTNDLFIELNEDKIQDHHMHDLPDEVVKVLNIYKVRYLKLIQSGKMHE